jgi:hypothetical protein
MSAVREAVVVPLLFLTVSWLGGLDLGTRVALLLPAPFSLVLATILFAALVRSGALAPDRLLHGSRTPLENANGALVLATLVAASAQILAMLTPRSGLPRFFADVLLLALLLNTIVTRPDRVRLLRSLAVILGSAFVLTFVLLAALSDPSGSRTARILVALFDAATFGAIAQDPPHPAAGYLALLAIGLYLAGVALLPGARVPGAAGIVRVDVEPRDLRRP